MVSIDTIQEIGLRIGRQFSPERVILFGSHAEGRAGSALESDAGQKVIRTDIELIRSIHSH